MTPYAVEETFDWGDFVRRYWDKQPVLYKRASAAPFAIEDVFCAASEAGRALQVDALDGARRATFTVERMQHVALAPWVPRRSDRSFAGYHDRLVRRVGPRRYGLVLNAFHSYWFPLWSRERDFFAGLWRRVGLPSSGAITTLFHGNYEHTPVGVHVDRFSTFLFALSGRKRMRFWKTKPWTEPVTTVLDYQQYLDTSFAVDVAPGDILYWPSTYYHVGENVGGELATSVNVGIPRTEHRAVYELDELLVDLDDAVAFTNPDSRLARLLPEVDVPALVKGSLEEDGSLSPDLPGPLARVTTVFRDMSRRGAIATRLQTASLRRLSSGGFTPSPSPDVLRVSLSSEARVCGSQQHPILWGRDGGQCLCAANGHVFPLDLPAQTLVSVLARLNTGSSVRVGDLLGGVDSASRRKVGLLLHTLHCVRAVRLEPSSKRS